MSVLSLERWTIVNNLARRAAEHLAGKGIQIEKLMGGLSRPDARAVEQALMIAGKLTGLATIEIEP